MAGTSSDRSGDVAELECLIADSAKVIFKFRWGELASRLPVGRVYTRPAADGAYQAVEWRCCWLDEDGGPIICEIAGFLSPDHQAPIAPQSHIISKTSFAVDLAADAAKLLGWLLPGKSRR